MSIGEHIAGAGDWPPDPNTTQYAQEFIENGGHTNPKLDAIQEGDFHDLPDQNGGPEWF